MTGSLCLRAAWQKLYVYNILCDMRSKGAIWEAKVQYAEKYEKYGKQRRNEVEYERIYEQN
jgi:hypothetical protein